MNDTKDFDFWRKYYTAFSRAETLLVLASPLGKNEISEAFRPVMEQLPEYDAEAADYQHLRCRPVGRNVCKPRFAFT